MAKNNQADLFQTTVPLSAQALTDEQRIDWLRLSRTPSIGPVTFRDLINHYGSARAAIEEVKGRQFGNKKFSIISSDEARRELDEARKFGAYIVALGEASYPRYLQSVDGAPPLLYVKGRLELSSKPAVAIVGSRNASATGMKFAAQLAGELGASGMVLTSGLARGIDAMVHQGSIDSGTIAVLGGGLDHIYPAQNEELYHRIASEGLLVSERPLGFYAQARDFPRRNRIISGISLGTIVVEAALRSGSLTTARFAGEQGREVFAVPGHPLDPRASGTNRLIKDGAGLVLSAGDVMEALAPQFDHDVVEPEVADGSASSSSFEERESRFLNRGDEILPSSDHDIEQHEEKTDLRGLLLSKLTATPIERDSLTRVLGCSARQLQIVLLELDLEGMIEHHGQQRVSLLS